LVSEFSTGTLVLQIFWQICYIFPSFRDIGTIIRSLGCFPTEAEVQEVITKVEEESSTGHINLEKFLPVMTKIILSKRFCPIPEDVLLHAFKALDQNKCEYIAKEDLVKYLTEE
ncbi:DRC8 protein, partial [Crotophaga sulcirostris]|nr:DRC8 protein [Crotophaga sulcirostris]